MCALWPASRISTKPISRRTNRPRISNSGFELRKREIGPAKTSISATEMSTEPTMTAKMSVMPTTVRIESTEKMRFMPTIRATTSAKRFAFATSCSTAFSLTRSSLTPFQIRNRPPTTSTSDLPSTVPAISTPRNVPSKRQSSVVAAPRTRLRISSSTMRSAIARTRPSWIACLRLASGSLLAMIVMMIRLSAPSAIWISVTEKRAAQKDGCARRSITRCALAALRSCGASP